MTSTATGKRKRGNSTRPSKKKSKTKPTTNPPKSASITPSPKKKKTGGSHPVDPDIGNFTSKNISNLSVVQNDTGYWYDATLNQCNITGSNNNNKYYRIQMLKETNGYYYVWFKWGRVGEPNKTNKLEGPFSSEANAVSVYAKKYKSKTGNAYDAEVFVSKKNKYTLIEIDNDVEVDADMLEDSSPIAKKVEYLPSELDPKTKDLVEVLFSEETRNQALTSFNLDLKKLPLGVPSEEQIQKGVSILNQIENKLNGEHEAESYAELASNFYTAIPHSFGRKRPPQIQNKEALQNRYDMCNILIDMHSTNETIRKIKKEDVVTEKVPNPTDSHYKSMKADLSILSRNSKEYRMIQAYFDKTKSKHSNAKLHDVWCVNRQGEGERFEKFDKLDNRRLLWHGTNIAVVAPILTSGLRIMPHSGGRVGSGIYLASMQEKSAQYTRYYGSKYGCMFLAEAALGKMHRINSDGHHASSLKKAPEGYDSVLAVGNCEPTNWKTMKIDNRQVQIPQGECKPTNASSSFHHDEFLAYEEAQVRLRYMITVTF